MMRQPNTGEVTWFTRQQIRHQTFKLLFTSLVAIKWVGQSLTRKLNNKSRSFEWICKFVQFKVTKMVKMKSVDNPGQCRPKCRALSYIRFCTRIWIRIASLTLCFKTLTALLMSINCGIHASRFPLRVIYGLQYSISYSSCELIWVGIIVERKNRAKYACQLRTHVPLDLITWIFTIINFTNRLLWVKESSVIPYSGGNKTR